jgi:tetratricopeptide (TPR) repeat protein
MGNRKRITSHLVVTKVVLLLTVAVICWQCLTIASFAAVVAPPVKKHQIREEITPDNQQPPAQSISAATYYSWGLRYHDLGRWHKAIEAFKKATVIKPDYELAYFGLGIVYSQLETWEKALTSFQKAVELSPDYAAAYLGLGIAYTMLGRNNDAVEVCRKAIRIKPGYAQAHYALGLNYLMLGDRSSARKQQRILETLDQDLATELIDLIDR